MRLTDLSCDRSPDGSLHAFASGNLSPIPSITERRSLFPSSSTHYSIRRPHDHPCLPNQPDAALGLPCSVQVTELGRFRLFAGDTSVSVFAPSKQTTDHMPFWLSPILQVAFGSSSLTTFNSGSLTLTIQSSLAPHPGATPRIMPDPSRDMTYPIRWLLCQSAQHPTVTSDAPLLDYRGLNPGSCHSLSRGRTITYTAFAVLYLSAQNYNARFCTFHRNGG